MPSSNVVIKHHDKRQNPLSSLTQVCFLCSVCCRKARLRSDDEYYAFMDEVVDAIQVRQMFR
jgi:hypothetical protein